MLKAFLESQFGLLVVCLLALLVLWLISRALYKLGTFAHNAADKAASEGRAAWQVMLLRSTEALAKCAGDAVLYVEQTMRPKVLGAAEGGKLTPEQAKALKDEAIALALTQAKALFGKALEQVSVASVEALTPTVEHLVESAAQRVAGQSRAQGIAPVPQQPAQE